MHTVPLIMKNVIFKIIILCKNDSMDNFFVLQDLLVQILMIFSSGKLSFCKKLTFSNTYLCNPML